MLNPPHLQWQHLPIPSHLVRITWIQTVSIAQASQECRLKGGFIQVQELLDFPTNPSPPWPFPPVTRLPHFGGRWLSVLHSPTSLVTGSGQHLSSKNRQGVQITRRKGNEAARTDGSEDKGTEGKSATCWRGCRAQCSDWDPQLEAKRLPPWFCQISPLLSSLICSRYKVLWNLF